jgi:ribosome biogenesis GTPase / thiamine phosphate phosphatase
VTAPDAADAADLGWDDRLAAQVRAAGLDHLPVARVVRGDAARCVVLGPSGRRTVPVRGLVVGDWVVLDGERVVPLERRTALRRASAGRGSQEQVLAAGVDVVLVVEPLDPGANLRRIERLLTLAWASGAVPVVVLTKADRVHDDPLPAVRRVAPGVEVLAVSAATGDGLDDLRGHMSPRDTFVLLGPSGAGKSTLANALAGRPVLEVGEVRGDGRGRHTTTRRELVAVPGVGLLIDTPGIRAVGLTGDAEGVERSFEDVVRLAGECRFRDCAHGAEPGCAVQEAVLAGDLDAERLAAYRRLQREAEHQAARSTSRDRSEERRDTAGRRRAVQTVMRAKGR